MAKKKVVKKSVPRKRVSPRKTPKPSAALQTQPKIAMPTGEPAPLEMPLKGNFPIVGIGASAGGLEAFEEFFKSMPPDNGMGFVLVPHLDPSHTSMLPELLKRYTTMKVDQAADGMKVEPNHVYIIPPNRDMAIFHGTLQLTAMEKTSPRGLRMPIDSFLRSLADDQGEMAICIILSGSGSDGSMGVRAVHAAGGMTMAQEISTAKYEGMPRSAIDTNLVDFVLPASKMPEQLVVYGKKIFLKKVRPVSPIAAPSSIQKIMMILRSQTGHDFSSYKKSTVLRRIDRRMIVHNIEDPELYARYLREHKEEVRLLFKELLITVTSFFRDRDAFEVLKKRVWPKLLEARSEESTLRIWVPGCSTGEEAFSIGITLREYMTEAKWECKAQIFGTDIDEEAINKARSGVYPDNIAIDVSQDRLRRFFTKDEEGYRVKKDIREMIVFAVQNVITDAPFTKIDLVSCRNFLIYVEPELQNRLLPLFHYSLKPGGVLFLGSSESIGRFSDLFTPLDKKWKFFEAKGGSLTQATGALPWVPDFKIRGVVEEEKKARKPGIIELTQRLLLNTFAPPTIIVDEKGEILYIHGQTGKYLEPATGPANLSLLSMAREGVRFELRSAFHNVIARNKEVRYSGLKVKTNGGEQEVNLIIRPLLDVEGMQNLLLVSFEEPPSKPAGEPVPRKRRTSGGYQRRIEDLERELNNAKETLQTTVEEMQASNEELKSANEELQSTNEELQSTNEELETSKEELQSVNEELVTVNSELQGKIEQLSRTENDMKALLDSIRIGALFLGPGLNIRRFTSEVVKFFNLIPTDVGRPVSDIRFNLRYDDLVQDAKRVLQTLQNQEMEIESEEGKWYWMRIMPTRSSENVIDGIAITFTDISAVKRAQEEVTRFQSEGPHFIGELVNIVRGPLVILDEDLRVLAANEAFYTTFQIPEGDAKGKRLYNLKDGQWDIPALRALLEEVSRSGKEVVDYSLGHDSPAGRKKIVVSARRLQPAGMDMRMILLALEDVAEG
jgi:two-component system, chemotaxis family, CheB/CheR fusion protein